MPDNSTIGKAIAAAGLVNANIAGEVIREIDLGEIAEVLRPILGDVKLKVCVNPAAYITPILWKALAETPRDDMLNALSVMTGIKPDVLDQWGDAFVSEIYLLARAEFLKYDEAYRKNLKAQ